MIYFVTAELDYEGFAEKTISVRCCQGECVNVNRIGVVSMIPFADGRYAAWEYICITDNDSATKVTDDAVASAFKSSVRSQVAPYHVQYSLSGSSRDLCSASKLPKAVMPLCLKINEYGDVEGTVLAVDEHDAIMQAKAYAAKRLYALKDIPSC